MLTSVTVMVGAVALLVSSLLVFLAAVSRDATSTIGNALESGRIVEESKVDLLLHGQAIDPQEARAREARLRNRVQDARGYVSSELERAVQREAEVRVVEYLDQVHDPDATPAERDAHRMWAYRALEHLGDLQLDRSRRQRERAAGWNRLATYLGVGVAVLLVCLSGTLVWWLRRRALHPLTEAMTRIGRGERDVRARETGPAEVRSVMHQFNEMADALAAQRAAQMAFLAGVAHDLRSPLTALRATVDLIDPDQPLPGEDRVRGTLARVSRQIAALDRMVGDLLNLAKLEVKELELRREPRDVRTLVQDVADLFGPASVTHHLELSLPGEPAMCMCDPLRVEQMLANLLSNAVKYSPAGGPVAVSLIRDGDELVISVTDRGIGIPTEEIVHLFEPFHRPGAARHGIPGSGVGLYVVRRIAEAHGGRVDVHSRPGEGSTFRVHLPALEPQPTRTIDQSSFGGTGLSVA